MGVAALIDCANDNKPLPIVKRPLYSFTMRGVVTCFTGIRERSLAVSLIPNQPHIPHVGEPLQRAWSIGSASLLDSRLHRNQAGKTLE